MIKTLSSIALAGLVAATITGCGATPETKEEVFDNRCKVENVLAPQWACVPMVEGAYAGVGIAAKSAAGMGHMRRVALANGRSDLAQQIKAQVKDKVETFTRTTGVGDSEVVDQVNTAVSKQVAKVDLAGSKGVDMWTAPSGAIYMLVTVPEATVNGEVKQAVKTSFKNDEALWQQFQAKNALEGLEKEFPTD
ncbi:MAG: LPP20 family lipoprotein [Sulfurimonas sp.]|uniref:LPP20 family lipoprotein n=1 Tax=Sulfurimonas sp. TaxID=2022749 RepID=UPI0025D1C728|nr:LPP20 family lipoprotein [Sulfurimonas sp.]MCK9491981.1 LPP20 family lipoprotein [Sulfurimonas sp.]